MVGRTPTAKPSLLTYQAMFVTAPSGTSSTVPGAAVASYGKRSCDLLDGGTIMEAKR